MTGWPVDLRGITESVVTTREPGGQWNAAALGLHAGDPVTSRTWGDTRTRRNFERDGHGYVQFTHDPLAFVEAALSIYEVDDPVIETADAWVEVEVERIGAGESGGTRWEEWAHDPVDSEIRRRVVPAINRGFNAVVEATVWASRLDVDAYDDAVLRERLDYLEEVVHRCGGEHEHEAMDRLFELADE